jgi:hypothetical protein
LALERKVKNMMRGSVGRLLALSSSFLSIALAASTSLAEDLGANMAYSPGAGLSTWGADRLDVWVTGADHVMYHRSWNQPTGWTSWDNIGGAIVSKPATVSWGYGRIDVFGLNSAGSVMHRAYDVNQGGWDPGWDNYLGGSGFKDIAVDSQANGFLDVFVIQSDGKVRFRQYSHLTGWTPNWVAPTTQDDKAVHATLSATSWGSGRIDLLAHSCINETNPLLYCQPVLSAHNTATPTGFGPYWDQIPDYTCYGADTVPPGCALTARGYGSLIAVTRNANGKIGYSTYSLDTGWSPWQQYVNWNAYPLAAVSRSATLTDVLAVDNSHELFHIVL